MKKKKLFIIICVVLVVVCVAVVAAVYNENYLPEAVKKEIEAAWPYDVGNFSKWNEPGSRTGVRYLGKINSYYILYDDDRIDFDVYQIQKVTIGPEVFVHSTDEGLYAYRDGEIIELSAAYQAGLLEDHHISRIYKKFRKIQEEIWGADYISELYESEAQAEQ